MTQTTTKNATRFALLTGVAVLTILLGACQTTGSTNGSVSSERQAQIDQAIERAADNASATGNVNDSLALLEKLYKRNPKDADVATRYARALRDANRLTRANLVIEPFATAPGKVSNSVLTEYASVQTAMGNYAAAEKAAQRAVNNNPQSGEAYHVLGIALDAQAKHKPAEEAFRSGLEHWQGNPAPLLNNLGLNLAAQGFLDEAAETLRKALATSPNRSEIERNLRIVNALQVSGGQVPSYLADEQGANAAAPVEKADAVKKPETVKTPVAAPTAKAPVPAKKPSSSLNQ